MRRGASSPNPVLSVLIGTNYSKMEQTFVVIAFGEVRMGGMALIIRFMGCKPQSAGESPRNYQGKWCK